MDLPTHIRAIRVMRHAQRFRDAAEIVTTPYRAPGRGEIALRVRHIGVNALFDRSLARGLIDVPLPCGAGVEAIGEVVAVGAGVGEFAPGSYAMTTRFGLAYADTIVADAARFVKTPRADCEHLALGSTGVAAFMALNKIGEAKAGDLVAISAAAGGLGHLILQLAKHQGCRVLAIAGGAEKADFCRRIGADDVIDYKNEDVGARLRADFKDALNVAIDTVSGAVFDAFLDNLAPHGRLVIAGMADDQTHGAKAAMRTPIGHSLYWKGASVRALMNGLLADHWPDARASLFALYALGALKPHFDAHGFHGLDGVFDAGERQLCGASMGKVVVSLG
jgi:hypothetical protein